MAKLQAKKLKSTAPRWDLLWETTHAQVPAWALLLPVIVFAGVMSFRYTGCLDTGFHVKTGEWIQLHHSIPRYDPFSHSAYGQPWISHEWLFGVIAYFVDRAAGVAGLIGMKALFVVVLFVLTAWVAHLRGARPAWTAVALAGCYAIARLRFQERPEIISVPIAVGFLLIYEKSRRNRKWMFALPFLQLLWINLHGGTALLGWALAGAFAVDSYFELRTSGARPGWRAIRIEIAAFSGVIVASLVNPNFAAALTYGLLRTRSPLEIEEFRSLATTMQIRFTLAAGIFLAWAALLAILLLARRRNARVYDLILFPALLLVSVVFFRFSSLFAFLLAPALASQLSAPGVLGRIRWWLPEMLSAALLAGVAVIEFGTYTYHFGAGFFQGTLPVRAAEFVKLQGIQGKMFNSYGQGGYLIWSLWPDRQVYIDGREDVYVPTGIVAEYLDAFSSKANWNALVSKRQIDYAIVNYPEDVPASPEMSLDKLAFDRSRWALVFFDDAAAVYVRRNGGNDEVIRRNEIKAIEPLQLSSYLDDILADPARLSLFLTEVNAAFGKNQDLFRLHFLMGIFAVKRQSLDDGVREFQRTVEINPEYVPAYINLGGILLHQGRAAEARGAYRNALYLDPNNVMAKKQLMSLND
jgi:hypothetical protein